MSCDEEDIAVRPVISSVIRPLQGFAGLGFQLRDAFRRGQFLGHGTAEFLDGLADFGSDFVVGFVRLVLAGDFLAAQFVLRLGSSEEIGGKFGAAHVVEDLLALFFSPLRRWMSCAPNPP
jgi:hypothetical protein